MAAATGQGGEKRNIISRTPDDRNWERKRSQSKESEGKGKGKERRTV